MKNQGVVKFFAIALVVACLFSLSFTYKARSIESAAREETGGDPVKLRKYLDSIGNIPMYNLGYKNFTYLEVKERELSLGLDLQGGMNVVLEVSSHEIIRALANYNKSPEFNKALSNAKAIKENSTEDYVSIFVKEYHKLAPGAKLSAIFATKENSNQVKFTSSDNEVEDFLKKEVSLALDRTFKILESRINQFGVAQPNIQKLSGTGRIMVELPGVSNPERVRKLLQSSAKLEFWETYSNQEAYGFLTSASKSIKARLALTDSAWAAETKDTSATENKGALDLLKGQEAAPDTTVKADSTVADSAALAKAAQDSLTKDSANKANEKDPLIEVLRYPNVSQTEDGKYYAAEGGIIGFALPKDTARVNEFLNWPEVRAVIPGDVIFMWGNKIEAGYNAFALYAVKASKDGGPVLGGDVIADANDRIGQNGGFEVEMRMNTTGANIWEKITAKAASSNPKKQIAIVLDNQVYSAPTVQGKIPGGVSQITGNFTQEEAKDLANILKAGKLPAPAVIVEEAIVGPTLGKEAIRSGWISVILGFIAVILTMYVIYNTAGLVADIAVLANLFFIVGVLASLQASLTLPGIAGIILSLGMAVDANVLINERVKDELKEGKNLRTAIANGYKYAASAIYDSNITTLIAGFVLLIFGTGPIYGFAITLIIGIFCSLFTAFFITRIVFDWLLKRDKNIKFWFSYSETTLANVNFNFMGKKKLYFLISGIVIGAGLISTFTKGFDYGVDFEGGWSYVVKFDQETKSDNVRSELGNIFGSSPEVKAYGTDNTYKITTDYMINSSDETASAQVRAKLDEGLKKLNTKYEVASSSKVGPTVASDLKWSATLSIIFATAGMFIYILARFRKWEFALSTVIKILHDVLVLTGLFSLLDGVMPFTMEVDQNFIAAVLTIIGYSINDSVVVLDRVREYLGLHKKAENQSAVINDALNKTLSRTLLTSLTTLFVVILLLFFGGETIRAFSFAMAIGIIVGTYSSLCIGSPLAAIFMGRKKDQ